MDNAPTPAFEKPSGKNKKMKNEEIIIESEQYKLAKDDIIYNVSINKTKELLLIKSFNYENRLSITNLAKLTKNYMDNINDAYIFVKKIFDNDKVIIKNIEKNKIIKLQFKIFDFTGKEKPIDIDLIYNPDNKDIIIEELSFKCNYLEEEISKLKIEMKELKEEVNGLNYFKQEISKLKSIINERKEKEIIKIADKINNINENINIEINKLKPIVLLEKVSNSYSDWGLDNVFTAFTSFDKIPYLIFSTKDKSLIVYNLDLNKIINTIKKPHDCFITNINHFYDKEENKDIIMTVSAENNNVKLWDLKNFKKIISIKNINKKGNLLSACFLNNNNKNYVITSNGDLSGKEFEPIKLFDFKGKKIMELKNSIYNTNFITTFYEKETSNNYILTGNDGFVNSYDIIENSEPKSFKDPSNSHRSVVVIYSEAIKKLIATSDDGNVIIWNFNTGDLIKIIKVGDKLLRGICELDERYIFIGSKDKTIKLIDINKGEIIQSSEEHNNTILTMKVINLNKYGKCLISQGMGEDHINLWRINYNIK